MMKIPKISEAEWEVMKALWAESPRSSAEVVKALTPHTHWKPNTIKTLLSRLVKKGAVAARKSGREHAYSPQFTEAQCIQAESKSFLLRVYDGSMMPMIVGFIQHDKLSREEIDQLRQLLDEMESEKRS